MSARIGTHPCPVVWRRLRFAFLLTILPAVASGQSSASSKALEEGDRLLRTGYPVLALRQYGEALEKGARGATVKLRMVHAHCAAGDLPAADKLLGDLLKSSRPTNEIRLLMARVRFWQHRYDTSWRWFRDYLKHVPGDEEARMDYALSLAWGRQFDAALVEMEKLEKTDRYGREATLHHAEILAWKKQYGPARALATKLLGRRDAPATFKARCAVLIGGTFAWEKQYAKAEAEYRKALAANPYSEVAWLALGEVQEWQGRRKEARAAYAKALQVSPASPRAQAALKRLANE